jgi:hypothetical protein
MDPEGEALHPMRAPDSGSSPLSSLLFSSSFHHVRLSRFLIR